MLPAWIAALLSMHGPGLAQLSWTSDLTTAAAASARPEECGGSRPMGSVTAWDRARRPGLVAYCLELARGYTSLGWAPAVALKHAKHADALAADRAPAAVLQARALVALGRRVEAWPLFQRAEGLNPKSLEAPVALHDFALSAAATGATDRAVAAYRALVPRASLVADPWRREHIFVEAAVHVMGLGAAGLDEAIAYLGEARRSGTLPGSRDFVLGCLALALDRQGKAGEAVGVANEASGPWVLEALTEEDSAAARADGPDIPLAELHAIVAILAERRDGDIARGSWQRHLERAPDGPFAEYARKKLARTGAGRSP